MNGNLFERLSAGFPADRHAVLLETAAGEDWSCGRILDLAGRMATVLRAAGVAPGDRVAAQAATSPEAVCLYLACLQTGAVFAPLDPAYAPAELAWLLDDLEPRVVVCDPEAEAAVAGAARMARAAVYTLDADGEGRLVAEARGLPSDRAVAARAGGDLALILRSSGPDGRSRGAMLSHDNLWSNVAALHWLWGCRPDDVLIHALPLHRAEGLAVALNLALMNGGGMLLLPRFDAEQVVACLPAASVLIAGAEDYAALVASPGLTEAACDGMRLFVAAGAPLSAPTRAAFSGRSGRRVLEAWGAPEVGIAASAAPAGAGEPGPALPGISLRATGADGAPPGPGEAGRLEVRGPNVCKGYWRDPEATAEFLRADGWFVTETRAAILPDGGVRLAGAQTEPDRHARYGYGEARVAGAGRR